MWVLTLPQGRSSHVFIHAGHDEMIKFETVSEGYLQMITWLILVLERSSA
jgi:hypothetical protein